MNSIQNCSKKRNGHKVKINIKKFLVGICASTLSCTALFACAPSVGSGKETITLTSPTADETVVIANDEVAEWFSPYLPGSVGENYGKGDIFYGQAIKFSWDTDMECDYYVVDIHTVGNYKDEESFRTTEKSIMLDDLYVLSDYEWTVIGYKDGKECAKGQSKFKTAKSPRAIKIDGVSNTRDIAFFSPNVKQGMIYRSAALDAVTDDGVTDALYRYEIKTDIDLRNNGEGTAGTVSPLGKGVAYYSLPGAYYVKSEANVTDPKYQKNMAQVFKILADESNYPVVFHCAIGRDRTGTLAAVIQAFLGAGYDDIIADYEMSFFSEAGCRDNAKPDAMSVQINDLYSFLEKYGDGTVRENTEKYLLDIGVSQSELDEIKRIMRR